MHTHTPVNVCRIHDFQSRDLTAFANVWLPTDQLYFFNQYMQKKGLLKDIFALLLKGNYREVWCRWKSASNVKNLWKWWPLKRLAESYPEVANEWSLSSKWLPEKLLLSLLNRKRTEQKETDFPFVKVSPRKLFKMNVSLFIISGEDWLLNHF